MRRWLWLLCGWPFMAQGAPSLPFAPLDGPYKVGFRVVEQYDASRSYGGAHDSVTGEPHSPLPGRPIQTLLWYPAGQGGTSMVYGDYLRLAVHDDHFARSTSDGADALATLVREYEMIGSHPQELEQTLHEPVDVRRDAPPTGKHFPVIIYAASDGSSAFENDRLCSYLASHGYLVIASPSLGSVTRYMTDERPIDDLENTEAQAADIGFLIGYAHTLPQADVSRLALVGYSWGGMAAAFATAHDSRVRALVELEGSVRYYPALVRKAGFLQPERYTLPVLYVADRQDPMAPGKDALPNSLINQLRYADLYEVTMHTLSHEDFASDNLRLGSLADHHGVTQAQINEGYGWMARYTLAFLDASLKDDAPSVAFLGHAPADNGVPAGLLSISRRPGNGEPATLERFAAALAAQQFSDPASLYADFHRHGLTLGEAQLEAWESALMDGGRAGQAWRISQLQVALFPHSADAWLRLAMTSELAGHASQAMAGYKHALQLDAKIPVAAERLRALQVPTATGR